MTSLGASAYSAFAGIPRRRWPFRRTVHVSAKGTGLTR